MKPVHSRHAPTVPLSDLFELRREQHPEHRAATFRIAPRQAGGRWRVTDASAERDNLSRPAGSIMHGGARGAWRAVPREQVGDAPQKYHPLYVAAILSARMDVSVPPASPPAAPIASSRAEPALRSLSLAHWPIPQMGWTTASEVRRSMTLNGMRMSLEYRQTGSLRVLQLVESRLAAGQRDVAHDVLVYLIRQVMDVRASEQEARGLHAQSVAAYLGLSEPRVRLLFAARRLSAASMSAAIAGGFAGPVRRSLDVPALIASQLRHLRPQLQALKEEEDRWLWLLDQITARLYHGS